MQIYKNKPKFYSRILSFLSSLIFHAALFYLLVYLFPPISIITFEQKVRDVIIVSPEKLFLPNLEEELPEINSIDEFLVRRAQERKYGILKVRNKAEGEEISKDIQDESGEIPLNPRFPSQFRIDKTFARKKNATLTYSFDFSLKPRKEEITFREKEKVTEKEVPDLSKYIHSDYPHARYTGTHHFSPSLRRGNILGTGSATSRIINIDISQWAEGVIHQIQQKWSIPYSHQINEKDMVKILVVVQKDGNILSAKIIDSSRAELFDQAALKAISLSSPLPKLPDDFPYENLEIFFVFQSQ
ncbi:MAG: TonB family protein [Candidatus Aminicenantaceae bacterium]